MHSLCIPRHIKGTLCSLIPCRNSLETEISLQKRIPIPLQINRKWELKVRILDKQYFRVNSSCENCLESKNFIKNFAYFSPSLDTIKNSIQIPKPTNNQDFFPPETLDPPNEISNFVNVKPEFSEFDYFLQNTPHSNAISIQKQTFGQPPTNSFNNYVIHHKRHLIPDQGQTFHFCLFTVLKLVKAQDFSYA